MAFDTILVGKFYFQGQFRELEVGIRNGRIEKIGKDLKGVLTSMSINVPGICVYLCTGREPPVSISTFFPDRAAFLTKSSASL